MKLTNRQKMFLHEAIHSKLTKTENMIKYLNDEVAKENSIEMKNSYKSCIKWTEIEIEELKELRRMFND